MFFNGDAVLASEYRYYCDIARLQKWRHGIGHAIRCDLGEWRVSRFKPPRNWLG